MIIPFADFGRDWDGCDCWGIVRLIYKEELGIELGLYGGITVHDVMKVVRNFNREFRENWSKVSEPVAFDVAAMVNESGSRAFAHCGIMLSDSVLLHMRDGAGIITGNICEPGVSNQILGFYRYGAVS